MEFWENPKNDKKCEFSKAIFSHLESFLGYVHKSKLDLGGQITSGNVLFGFSIFFEKNASICPNLDKL